ncbi:inorganic phosphate transporter [Pseudogemmatithrix spongiicola]|uniref:Inorganic phosphate transporter n=1 Tax=Pseudogemmatithrix spongiicola TaxID=3062599 RepID=A0AA49JVR3_9BACT|nr:inorganic phosphate transporter [Gemmatimonadaceae bacterium 'strain 138']WKW15680.1 inorganic phosphate transporter [Gemmatimonadaceae bacterium 'strain 318']
MVWYILVIVLVAFIFDYINGFHDSANSIATIVGTRVLSPFTAVVWAATFNFLALFLFDTKVAKTIGKGMIDLAVVNPDVILAGLLGAITWNLITWWYGIPSSSSHALIGGYAGAAITKAGFPAIIASGWTKTIIFIVVSPLVGMAAGWALMVGTMWLFRNQRPAKMEPLFRGMQITSSALFSLSHGANDAQKTMGIIVSLLVAGQMYFVDETGFLRHFYISSGDEIPFWIKLGAHFAIAMGTLMGGWRIVHTLGSRVTKLRPIGGFCAETGGASAIFLATFLGIPVSTTHTISGAIVGVGATQRLSAVRWGVASRMIWAWIITIPASAAVAAISYLLVAAFRG